ncbi:hypothetical protein [Streptomyces sp. H34-S4]|uniref:hypothetical protein n=1 Tax=Streptomyces sp. H34-S4 TaxID=2996463 RepID=UPI00226FD611|nr:hypothetical protein [Streptomyces sp. H34-S4]MCY0933670.1 hypothetical protein [Streptomyces sp. H34-S4]
MSNGWDWVREGQRIAEESMRAGELDIEAIKAGSIVFEGPLVTDDMKRELENCHAGHCEAAYKQNSIGGEARHVVHKIARVVGQPMSPALDRDIWSPANMGRVIAAVQQLVNENEALRDENLRLRVELVRLREAKPATLKALHEALSLLGDGV